MLPALSRSKCIVENRTMKLYLFIGRLGGGKVSKSLCRAQKKRTKKWCFFLRLWVMPPVGELLLFDRQLQSSVELLHGISHD